MALMPFYKRRGKLSVQTTQPKLTVVSYQSYFNMRLPKLLLLDTNMKYRQAVHKKPNVLTMRNQQCNVIAKFTLKLKHMTTNVSND